MSNQLHKTLEEAIANAPFEPVGAYCEVNPIGSPPEKSNQLRAIVRRAIAAGLKVELLAAEATFASVGMDGLNEFDGAAIHHSGSADQPGYFRVKVCRPIRLRS